LRETSDGMDGQEYVLFTEELVRCLNAPHSNQCMVRATIQRQFGQGYSYFENLYYVQENFIFVTSQANSTIDLESWALFTEDESIRKWGVPGRYASPADRGFDRMVIDEDPSAPLSCVSLAEYTAGVPLSQDGRCGPLFGTRCSEERYPWCSEASGWCGDTEEHRNAQASTKYDWRRRNPIQRGNTSLYSVMDPSIMITDFLPHYTPHLYHMMENLLGIWATWRDLIDQRGSGITSAPPEWLVLPQHSIQSLETRSGRATRGLVRAVFPEIKIIDSRALRSLGQRGAVYFPKLVASDRSAADHGEINQMLTGIRRRLAGLMLPFWAAISRNLEIDPATTREGDVVVTFVEQAAGNRGLARSLARELLWELATLEAGINVHWLRFDLLTLREQVARASATDVLVGVHGNGLTHVLFIRLPGALVEIFPGEGSRIVAFQQLSELRGVAYYGLQAASGRVFREGSCDGLSSNVSQLLPGPAAPDDGDCVVEGRNLQQVIEKLDLVHVSCLVLGAIHQSQIGPPELRRDPRDRCWPRCSAYPDGRRSATKVCRAVAALSEEAFDLVEQEPCLARRRPLLALLTDAERRRPGQRACKTAGHSSAPTCGQPTPSTRRLRSDQMHSVWGDGRAGVSARMGRCSATRVQASAGGPSLTNTASRTRRLHSRELAARWLPRPLATNRTGCACCCPSAMGAGVSIVPRLASEVGTSTGSSAT